MYRIYKNLALECGNGRSHRGEADDVLNIISCQGFDHLLILGTEDSMLSFTVFNKLAIISHCHHHYHLDHLALNDFIVDEKAELTQVNCCRFVRQTKVQEHWKKSEAALKTELANALKVDTRGNYHDAQN